MRLSTGCPRLRTKLWIAGVALAVVVIGAIAISRSSHDDTDSPNGLGLDYIAFYRAGALVRQGHADRLYDLADTQRFEHALAEREQLPLGDRFGPFYNPPLVAWMFAPLSALDYRTSLHLWWSINLGAFAVAMVLACRMIPTRDILSEPPPPLPTPGQSVLAPPRIQLRHYDRALIPFLTCLSMPFMQSIGHAQNTCISLLILAFTVTAWRAQRPVWAGFFASLLFYKPQLGAVVLAAIVLDLGWAALASAAATLTAAVALNLLTLPGTLTEYANRLGPNLTATLALHPYVWMRHVTLRALWQLLLPGQSPQLLLATTLLCAIPLAIALIHRLITHRDAADRDRSIATVIAAAPLLMPYYLDYDLLLLAVPAVLIAGDWINGRSHRIAEVRCWIAFYLLLMIDAGLTGVIHFNIAVPLLGIIAIFNLTANRGNADDAVPLIRFPLENPFSPGRKAGVFA